MCLTQASSLELLRQKLIRNGLADVKYVVVNTHIWHARVSIGELTKRVNIPVYQDNNRGHVWKKLNGRKDDFFIYDRCGRLVFHIPLPNSLLTYPYVEAAILTTYYDTPCPQYCEHDPAFDTIPPHMKLVIEQDDSTTGLSAVEPSSTPSSGPSSSTTMRPPSMKSTSSILLSTISGRVIHEDDHRENGSQGQHHYTHHFHRHNKNHKHKQTTQMGGESTSDTRTQRLINDTR
ncbi:unnamed protein product [Owenia fusiformis]|uniref:Uncharacterized protein n=1 Tax=Owenia fusiformis TaxID=6347 RepID=A0A8J1XNV0_OWEFU|nr:unnamed protein product [Owenia fusiformis]